MCPRLRCLCFFAILICIWDAKGSPVDTAFPDGSFMEEVTMGARAPNHAFAWTQFIVAEKNAIAGTGFRTAHDH